MEMLMDTSCVMNFCKKLDRRMTGKPTKGRKRLQLFNDLVDKDYTTLKRQAVDRSTWHATNRREMSKTCYTADN